MDHIWNEERLNRLIRDKVEEGLRIEYKAPDALKKTDGVKKEITKDISAMANSDGGVIIYGIGEDKIHPHLPGALAPVNRNEFSKEWLEQVINNIRPRIQGLEIHPVAWRADEVYFVVEIPKSDTAHQALDYRYYRRFNFEAVPMYDHEIRDVMNRQKVAKVEVEIIIRLGKQRIENHVFCRLANKSLVMVEHAAVVLRIPFIIDEKVTRFPDRNIIQGDDGFAAWQLRPSKPKLLFPEAEVTWVYPFEFRPFSAYDGVTPVSLDHVEFIAFADGMPPHRGNLELRSCVQVQSLLA
jgi:hypothetical protein